MANIVGDAYVVVRAITAGVEKDIRNAFNGTDRIGNDAGSRVGRQFREGFTRSGVDRNIFSNLLRDSVLAKERFSSLVRVGFVLQPLLTGLAGIIGLLGTSIISLASTIGASLLPALSVLGGSLSAVAQAALTLKLAFSGVAKAIQAGTKATKSGVSNAKALEKAEQRLIRAQRALADANEDADARTKESKERLTEAEKELSKAREKAIEDLQQLGFDSEDAAIAEQKAALELEKARENLARVSDLPPNSRARKEAELAFAQADLNYRRAIDKNNDLKKEEAKNIELAEKGQDALIDGQDNVIAAIKAVDDAKKAATQTELSNARAIVAATEARDDAQDAVDELEDGGSAADAYADALSDLSKEARAFAEYMVNTFIPALKDLKTAAGEELFPKLEEALENLKTNLFPALIPLLRDTGGVLGDIAKEFSATITAGENIKRLERIWKSNDKVLTSFGDAASNLYEVLLILLDTARPLTEEFAAWTATVTASWRETLKADEASGKLAKKFEIARGLLKDLGTILGNTFRGLGNLFAANVGPGSGGQIFLDYLKDVTKAFENLDTVDGRPIRDFFADAAVNGTRLFDLLGDIFGAFIGLADNEGLGIFLLQLQDVVAIFREVGENLDSSLPAFGNFLIQFATFVALVTESGSVTIFFNTLSAVLGKINEFLASDLGQRILNISAQILPLLAAFGLIIKLGSFFLKVVVGSFVQLIAPIVRLVGLFTSLGIPLGTVLSTMGRIALTFLKFAGIAGIIITVLIGLWQNSEIFRDAIMKMVDALGGALKGAFGDIMAAIKSVWPSFDGLKTIFKVIGDIIGIVLVPLLTFVLVRAIGVVSGAIQAFIFTVGRIKDTFLAVWNFIKGIFFLLTNQTDKAAESFEKAWKSAISAVKNAIKSIAAPFVGVLNAIVDAWNNSIANFSFTVPKWVPFIGGNKVTIPKLPRVNLASLAEGGIVLPSAGGTLARIAEAGRPERVEPLDPQGLSARDRAIIEELSGPGRGTILNVTVNPSPGMDERELAAIVSRQIAFQLRRGAA